MTASIIDMYIYYYGKGIAMSQTVKSASLLLAFVFFILTVFAAPVTNAATITTVYINGTDVRVRSTPSTENNNNIIEKISNTSATLLEKSGDWLKISYVKDGETRSGYVFYDPSYIDLRTYNPDADFETKISAFPESYRNALRTLHAQYPSWEFIPDPVNTSFSDAVAAQMKNMRKQVQMSSQPISWRSMGLGAYDWNNSTWVSSNGGWTGASREIIAYYMDPRNFLNSKEIYMFLEQSYNSAVQNEAGVKKIISGTFLENNYTPASGEPGGGSYLKVIMQAAKESNVSPYVIASKIIQEQGTKGTSGLISGTYGGYNGYYNFFNIGAYGSTNAEVIANGLERAKTNGWDTRYKSILGGARFLAQNYIDNGQDTYYYQDFNVHGGGTHQYAQAVHDAYNKGVSLAATYQSDTGFALSFSIPVFTDMPSTASAKPASSDRKNNYNFSENSVSGLTPSFTMYTYSYDLAVTGNTAVKVKTVSGATLASKSSYSLKQGDNQVVISVKSETGYTNDYTIYVNASKACTLYITFDGKLPSGVEDNSTSVMLGDPNGDGKISIVDLAKVQMHILKVKTLSGDALTAADVNKDGKISIVDLAKIQMHILNVKTIVQ